MAIREIDVRRQPINGNMDRFDKFWKTFLHQLINQMLLTQTSDNVDSEAIEKIAQGMTRTLSLFRGTVSIAKFELYKAQYGIINEAIALLKRYDPRKNKEKLIELRERLEQFTKLQS